MRVKVTTAQLGLNAIPLRRAARWLVCVLMAGASLDLAIFSARADVVVLTNGDRIEGQVVSETPAFVSLRRRYQDRDITYVVEIPRERVARIEAQPVASAPAIDFTLPLEPPPPASQPARGVNKPALLNTVLDRWDRGQIALAATEMTRLLLASTPAELDELSPRCEARAGMTLAAFAAEVHWRAARLRSEGGAIRITGAVPYEMPALAPRLRKEYEQALRETVAPAVKPVAVSRAARQAKRPGLATSQPAPAAPAASGDVTSQPAAVTPPDGEPLSIANWIDRPNELRLTKPEAAVFTDHVAFAASLIAERMRLDPEVRRDPTLQASLIGQRTRLLALWRAANAFRGSAADRRAEAEERAKKRAEQLAEQRRLAEEYRRIQEQQQNSMSMKALRMAQEQARQEAANAAKMPGAPAGPVVPGSIAPGAPVAPPPPAPPRPPNSE